MISLNIQDYNDNIPSVITVGTFDGIHLGHRKLIEKVLDISKSENLRSIVLTFDPHPKFVLNNDNNISLLTTLEEKNSLLESVNLDYLIIQEFSKEFSSLTPLEYVKKILVEKLNAKHIVIGYDHHFGYKREGSPEFLQEYANRRGINIDIINAVADDKVVLSSTHIRDLISNGFVRRASFELGWVYGFYAKVVHGSGRGKDLEFPTANIVAIEKNQLMPKTGVYLARGRVNDDFIVGMCNFGTRPTFNERELVMEINFFTSSLDDIYNREIYIEFLERIRDEKKFDNSDQLVKQLHQDREYCLELKKKYE